MEETQGMSQGQDTVVSQPVTSAPAPETQVKGTDERTFRQSEVTDIVQRAKSEAIEKYKRMAQEQPQYHAEKFGVQQQQQQPQNLSNNPEERLRQLASEETQKHIERIKNEAMAKAQDDQAQRTVQNFNTKVQSGRDKYQDYDKVAPNNDVLVSFPSVVGLLGDHIDNASDVLYNIGSDYTKLASIESLAQININLAYSQLQKLSQSIKDNEAAAKVKVPNAPLSQIRATNAGTDNGAMSVSDYRKKYKA